MASPAPAPCSRTRDRRDARYCSRASIASGSASRKPGLRVVAASSPSAAATAQRWVRAAYRVPIASAKTSDSEYGANRKKPVGNAHR